LAALQARWTSLQLRARQVTPPTRLATRGARRELVGQLLRGLRRAATGFASSVDDRATLATARRRAAPPAAGSAAGFARPRGVEDIFETYGVADDLAAALGTRVALAGGAR